MEWADRIGRRISPRDLHVFLAVTEEGSMTKAALRLAVSRPVVSRAIADLEQAVGVTLLDRAPEGVTPTRYGEALLHRARAVFDELRQGVEDLATLADPNAATLRIGSSPVNEVGLLPKAIERLALRYPRMRFVMQTGTVATRMDALRERRVDLALARAHTDDPGPDFVFEPLMHERLLVVTAANSPWAGWQGSRLAELVDTSWIVAQPELAEGSPVRAAFADALPERVMVSDSLSFRLSILQSVQHVTFMPDSAMLLAPQPPWLRMLPVTLPRWRLPVVIATLRHRRPTAVAARLWLSAASSRPVAASAMPICAGMRGRCDRPAAPPARRRRSSRPAASAARPAHPAGGAGLRQHGEGRRGAGADPARRVESHAGDGGRTRCAVAGTRCARRASDRLRRSDGGARTRHGG
ncbi:LysR family transcriptional regulator [Roseicella aquatilis]|uniref:LysR family transcriptional regulator n=1 Tax=Roseicella aquatilis TaxID=2527868 RepID=A0A4V2WLP1_9PROT|nr:LysR family transcriptional regulator [Roseicella aquatilis]